MPDKPKPLKEPLEEALSTCFEQESKCEMARRLRKLDTMDWSSCVTAEEAEMMVRHILEGEP